MSTSRLDFGSAHFVVNSSADQPQKPAEDAERLVVDPPSAGQRLDAYLAIQFPIYSRVRLRKLINAAEVRVNTRRAKAAYRLQSGDVIEVRFPPDSSERPVAEAIPLDVLYEDESLAVVNKPHGMVVHPSKGHWSGTLTAALAYRFGAMSQVGGPARPGIVHRLDRDTSGVIVVARNDEAHINLARQFELRTVEKEYLAICRGQLDRDRDHIDLPIGPHPYQREKMAIRRHSASSRPARTFYEVDRRFVGFLSLRVFPKTGRTHQIRVHLAHLGCPVLCDPLYAGQRVLTLGELKGNVADDEPVMSRLALHARRLSFDHPRDGRRLTFQADIPDELQRLLAILNQLRSPRS